MNDIISLVTKRPGMYVKNGTFDEVCSFFIGYDCAQNGGFLDGLREWLIPQLGKGSNLVWPSLALMLISEKNKELSEKEIILKLGELLTEFRKVKNDHGLGLRRIYLDYECWLRKQSWYSEGSPNYIDIEIKRKPNQKAD